VLVRDGTAVADLASAQDLRWAAVRASTLADTVDDSIAPDRPLKLYDDTAEIVAALQGDEVDAALLDMPLAVVTAEHSHGRLQAVAQLPTRESIAAALPKGSDNVEAVDSAMRAFTTDGTLHRLVQTWVGSAAADAESSIPLLHTTR
jgi:ABC-type amino acid transport substrate-binding protein